ncbi:hypothetical protein M758_5G172800 [Ceratodon purpureus]|nr:hypothetical protein M758_5G172800 [Ceratodon purpureus]
MTNRSKPCARQKPQKLKTLSGRSLDCTAPRPPPDLHMSLAAMANPPARRGATHALAIAANAPSQLPKRGRIREPGCCCHESMLSSASLHRTLAYFTKGLPWYQQGITIVTDKYRTSIG